MKIKTWRDPYDAGFSISRLKEIEFHPGLTVLVGCNGSGKTTTLLNIEEVLRDEEIPFHKFDNLTDGSSNTFGSIISGFKEYEDDTIEDAIALHNSSEGESIKMCIGRQARLYKEFLRSGYFKNKKHKFAKLFASDRMVDYSKEKKRFLLFDATDSGVSIDVIIDIKALFYRIIEDAIDDGIELYIIISSNEYELCRDEDCFDVCGGKYIRFSDYDEYRKFILHSREKKEQRIIRQKKWYEKNHEKSVKEYVELNSETDKKIQEIKESEDYDDTSWKCKRKVEAVERKLKDFVRNNRFLTRDDIEKINRERK